jgi:hypothetical protein
MVSNGNVIHSAVHAATAAANRVLDNGSTLAFGGPGEGGAGVVGVGESDILFLCKKICFFILEGMKFF